MEGQEKEKRHEKQREKKKETKKIIDLSPNISIFIFNWSKYTN